MAQMRRQLQKPRRMTKQKRVCLAMAATSGARPLACNMSLFGTGLAGAKGVPKRRETPVTMGQSLIWLG